MIEKVLKKQNDFELLFKLLYFALALLSFNSFCARHTFITYFSYVVVVLGAFAILLRFLHLKDYLNSKIWILVAFVVSYLLGSWHTREYGLMENFQAVIWMCLLYFAVFAVDKTRDRSSIDKEFKIISIFFLIYTFVAAVIGIAMLIMGYAYCKVVEDTNTYIIGGGFLWNRLYGCYMDPNYGAVFAIVSSFLSCYYLKIVTKNIYKVFLIANVIFEFIHISCSDSRTGLVALLISVMAWIFITIYRNNELHFKDKKYVFKNTFKKIIVAGIVGILIASIFVGFAVLTQKGFSALRLEIAKIQYADETLTDEELSTLLGQMRIGRLDEEINNGDVSNNRFAIWASAIDIFKANPITGISFRNIIEYARDEQPDGFIATSGFESMHNSFVDILVSQGIIGIALVMALIFVVFKNIFQNVKNIKGREYDLFKCTFACIVAVFGSMMFYSETFYMNTGGAFLFWYLLGLITNYQCLTSKETVDE